MLACQSISLCRHYLGSRRLEVFFNLSAKQAKLRAVSPGYAIASSEFEKAVSDISKGGKVEDALDSAADTIDADMKKNNNYR